MSDNKFHLIQPLRGMCPECGGNFSASTGNLTVRAHKKPGQPDRSRWCIGSTEKAKMLRAYIAGQGEIWVDPEKVDR